MMAKDDRKSDVEKQKNMRIQMPHTLVIIFFLVLLSMVVTWILPGGQYEKVEKEILTSDSTETREVIDPDSFKNVSSKPQNPWQVLNAVMKAMQSDDAASIIFFILLIGGAFGVINATGSVEQALVSLVRNLGSFKIAVIPIVMFAFSFAGAVFGMCEETIPFVAMAVPLALKLGYDSITGVAMVYLAAMTGFATAFFNPFTVGVAQGIAEVTPFSGWEFRAILWFLFTLLSVVWVMRYAARIKANPQLSPVYDLDSKILESIDKKDSDVSKTYLKLTHVAVLSVLIIGFVVIIYGATRLDWYINQMASMFLAIGIISGVISGIGLNQTAKAFAKGCSDICSAAILVGFARTVLVVLQEAMVMDTMLHYVSGLIGEYSPVVSVQAMYLFQTLTNFFVPSGSGQATLTMPIMTPLADLVGVSRQVAVLAYQFGDGFTNIIIPTSATTIAALAMGKVPWERWAKWVLPYVMILFALGAVVLSFAVHSGWA